MATLDNFLFVGDSFTVGLKSHGLGNKGSNVSWVCKTGAKPSYFLNSSVWSKMPAESKVKGICLLIGVNGWSDSKTGSDIDSLITKLLNKYPKCNVYVQRIFPVNSDYNNNYSGDWQDAKKAIATLNTNRKSFCNKTKRAIYIDTTSGFSNNGILLKTASKDGLHITDFEKWSNNIVEAIKNAVDSSNGEDEWGSTTDNSNGYPSVIKKLLPSSLKDKSYWESNMVPKWIVIHNMGAGNRGTNQTTYDWWSAGADETNASAHYCVEPTEVWQTLQDDWKGSHVGTPKKDHLAADRGCSNSNSIGIEIADSKDIDRAAAMEVGIELTRYLMKTHSISIDNVVQHFDVTGNGCPWWIRQNNKWEYFIAQIRQRNENNDPIKLNLNGANGIDSISSLPNFDNREDLVNIEEVKSVVLVHLPPNHFYSKKEKDKVWKEIGYDRDFHFEVDSKGFKTKKDNTLITWGMQSNDKHTYIDRALHKNKPYKYVLNLGIFTSEELEDYTVTEKILIDKIGKVLWDNGLETKDLWREFDLNRAASPFMYLEREQWKKLLREVDKQVKWRYENFGEPPIPEKTQAEESKQELTDEQKTLKAKNVGKKGITIRRCSLCKYPDLKKDRIKILLSNVEFTVLDFDNSGFYKIETTNGTIGYVLYSSVKITDDESIEDDNDSEIESYSMRAPKTPENTETEDNPDSDPAETDKGKGIPQPEITPTMTHKEYLQWKKLTDPRLIDNFAGKCEPYDKGLTEIIDAPILEDDRLAAATHTQDTKNENTLYYNVVEGSPGTSDHCAKPSNELSILYKPDPFKVEPIYPDLIVPPNYSTTDYNIKTSNALPLTVLEEQNGTIKVDKDFDSNDLVFDYDLLKDKTKKSSGRPINYLDPYPYDDKIYELENHRPKVKIDEIESILYDSNHPGDPIAQPIAKNFANVYDMALNQSKKVETRLVRIENTLATMLRNIGRIAARVNINCVYYGGQDTFGKYKTIRCMKDDRVHDACSVTLDQCLSCTRYEPIIGQIYEILDDTGVNGSVLLDNMQMSYMNLDETRNLNRVEERNSNRKFVNVNREEEETPSKLTDTWEKQDKETYVAKIKETTTDEKELEEKINKINQEDYAFKMNWYEQDYDLQEPDVKVYPTEGIKAKYKKNDLGDAPAESSSYFGDIEVPVDTIPEDGLIDYTDVDYIEDLSNLEKLNNGQWVDTREEADTYEENKYSSEDFYFEDFNNDDFYSNSGAFSDARNKIVEMAKQIVQDHRDLKAAYDQNYGNRTNNYDKKVMKSVPRVNAKEKVAIYDCSSLVSCCFNHAGLKEITYKTTALMWEYVRKNDCLNWKADTEGLAKAIAGDIVLQQGHVGIYIGNNEIAHASGQHHPKRQFADIRIDDAETAFKYSFTQAKGAIFFRPKDLIKADELAANTGGIGNPDFSGNTVAEKIFNFVKSQGGSDACAAGIVGNVKMESNFDSTLVNSIGCSGLFQIMQDRLAGLKRYASSKGKSWTDVETQIEWMWMEVTNTKPAGNFVSANLKLKGYTLDQFKSMTSPEEAAALFEHFYEVAGNKSKYCPIIKQGKTCRYCGSTPRKSSDKFANIRETSARSAYELYGNKNK